MTLYSSEEQGTRHGNQQEKKLQDHYRWKMWEHDNFLHCGVRVEHQKDGGFLLSQNEFADELREIQISSQRRKEKDSPVTPQERTELRGLLGGLGWKCEQRGPQHSAATEFQRSRLEQATVQDMIEANRLLQQVKKENGQVIRIFSFPTEDQLTLIGWCGVALQNRIDGGSTKGLLFTFPSVNALQREESLMSVISWRSMS